MLFSFLKILLTLFVGITGFVFWNLFCSQTNLEFPSALSHTKRAYIVNYQGNHNSLLLPGEKEWKEFSYGDWDVYGKSKITFWTGFKSMGIPSQGALGYRTIKWDGKDEQRLPKLLGSLEVLAIEVEFHKAELLLKNLEKHIESKRTTGTYNPQNHLFFVQYPKAYIAWHTCNNMLIDWLQNMGVRTKGLAWAGNFRVG